MNEEFYEQLIKKIQPYFEDGDGHGFDHTTRVYKNAIVISQNENINLDIVKAATLLHDIARSREENEDICHAEEGAKMAEKILEQINFPPNKIQTITDAIATHRVSKHLKAKTREAEILQDADRLDALGAIIIVRMLEAAIKWNVPIYDPSIPIKEKYDGSKSTVINHIYEKILKITPESFKTPKAQEIAKERYNTVKDFAEMYVKEYEGTI